MNRKEFLKGAAGTMAIAALCGAGLNDKAAAAEGTLEEKVQYLLDREAIAECQYRYARGCDMKDTDLLASAFDETITVYYPLVDLKLENTSGKDMAQGIVGSFVKDGITTQHYMNVYEIRIDGDTASGITYLRATHKKEGSDFWIHGGYYDNTYVRTENGWRIKSVALYGMYDEGVPYTG